MPDDRDHAGPVLDPRSVRRADRLVLQPHAGAAVVTAPAVVAAMARAVPVGPDKEVARLVAGAGRG